MNWKPKKIEQVSVGSIRAYENNARTHSPHQVELLASAIREFGFTTPLLMRSNGELVAGHGRLEAAKLLGMDKVPAIYIDHLSDRQLKALVISDNKIASLAGWNYDLLAKELSDLAEMEMDLGITGFNEHELDELLRGSHDLLPPDDPFTQAAYHEQRDSSSLAPALPSENRNVELVQVGGPIQTSGKIEKLEFRRYEIPMSEAECELLEERIREHIKENGSIVGFIAHLLS